MYQANLMDFFSKNIARIFTVKQTKNGKGKAGIKPIPGQSTLTFVGKRGHPEAEIRVTRSMSQKQGNEAQILELNEQDDESDGRIDVFEPKVQKNGDCE